MYMYIIDGDCLRKFDAGDAGDQMEEWACRQAVHLVQCILWHDIACSVCVRLVQVCEVHARHMDCSIYPKDFQR